MKIERGQIEELRIGLEFEGRSEDADLVAGMLEAIDFLCRTNAIQQASIEMYRWITQERAEDEVTRKGEN